MLKEILFKVLETFDEDFTKVWDKDRGIIDVTLTNTFQTPDDNTKIIKFNIEIAEINDGNFCIQEKIITEELYDEDSRLISKNTKE